MAQNNKPLYTLYESLKSDNYDVPDNYDSFERTLTAPGAEGTNSRLALYKSLKDDGYDVPDTYDSFANTLFSAKPRERDVQQQAVNAEAALTPVGNTDPMTIAANFGESSRKMVEDTRRMYEANTPAGRKKQQGLEIAGRMAGRNTRLPGLSVAMPTPEQPEASDGAQAAPKAQDMRGPQYYGTVVDPKAGQLNAQWLMPDGSLTTDFYEADVAAGEARSARLQREFERRMAINGLDTSKPEDVAAQQAYDRLAQLEARAKMHSDEKLAKLEERYEKAGAMERGQMLIGQSGNTATSMVTMPASVYGNGIYDDEDKLIAAERKNLEDAITAHHAGKLKKTGSFFAAQNLVNAWEGVKDVFKDGDTYTAGMISMHQSAQMLAIKAKLDKGEALTRGEESLLESMLVKQTIDENVEKPHGYTMGYTIANMVPFMIQMAMNPAAGAGGKLGNMAVKEFAKMMAKRAGQRAAKGFMMKAVARLGKKRAAAIAKGIGVTAGDIVASAWLANTLQAPATMADAALRHAGDVAYDKDSTLHFENGEGVIKAFAKAEGAMLIEDYTEMLGAHFGVIGGAIGRGTGKAVRKLGGGKLLDNVMKLCANIRATDWAKGIAAIERRAQWNGSVGEVLEEEAGIVLNSIFTGDNSISDLWDKEQQIDIVLGVGAFGAFVSGIKTAGYPIARHKARKALDERVATCEASFGKNWDSIREAIDMADEADLARTIARLGRRYATTPEKAKALLEYASAMAKARAFNIASASAEEMQTNPEQRQIDQSYNNGYTAEGSGRVDVQNLYNARRERAINTLDADTMRNLDANPLATLSGMASAGTYTDEELSVAREYAAAKSAYDGMQQSVEDEIEAQIWRCNAAIDARTNRDTGMVQRATYGLENREVYIIKGNVVADENGVIDRSASDDTIAIVDLETGETKMVASKDLGQAEQPIAAEQFRSSMAAYVRQEIGDRARAQAEGRLLFEENEKCLILDDEGSQSEVTILGGATDEQGAPIADAVKVQYADGTTGVVAMSELQERVNAAAAARMGYAEQERQQGAAARAAVDAEADSDAEQDGLAVEDGGQRRSFALNDEVELIADQGGVTSGMITGEIDSDGLIEVQTDKPVNGQMVNRLTLDELMQLLTRHNGEIVDEAEVEAPGSADGANSAEVDDGFIPIDPELIPAGGVDAAEDLDARKPATPGTKADEAGDSGVADEADVAPSEEASEESEAGAETEEAQGVEAMPMRTVKEKGESWEEPDYLAATPERAHSYIYNESGLNRQEANGHVAHMAKAAKEAVDKHKKSAPKIGGSIVRYQKAKTEWEAKGAELQRAVDFWDAVMAEQKKVTDAEKAALEAQQAQEHDEAVARFEEEQRIKAEKLAEQEAIGANAVNPQLKAQWDAAPKTVGNANAHVLADGSTITGHYVLTEAGAASASHDPNNAFAPTEGFPIDENGQNVNDRDYSRDKDAQRMVENMGAAFDSRALQTPVIVSQDGIVLSGNNRTMSGDLAAAQGTDKAYVDHLTQYGSMYGFTPEQVASMKHPRVVFVPDEALPYDSTTFSRFNAQEMKSQSKPEAAVKLGKIVPDAVFNNIVGDINRYERMSDFYANETAAASALGALHAAGVVNDAQMPELRTGTALSAAGKELLENTLLGKVFQNDPDAVRKIMEIPSMRQTIVMALAEVANNRALAESGFDIVDELSKAVDLCYRAKMAAPDVYVLGIPVSPFGRQQGLFDDEFGDSRVTDATTLLLADLLNDTKSSRLRNVLTLYNKEAGKSAAGSMDLFTGEIPSKEAILTEINNHFINATPKEQQAIVDAAIAERRATAEEAAGVAAAKGPGEGSQRPEQAPPTVQRSEGNGGEIASARLYDRTIPATPEAQRSAIVRIIDFAKRIKNRVERAVIGRITARQAKDFAEQGIAVDETWVHSFESSAVGHNQKQHGDTTVEGRVGQIAITAEDYTRIPEILESYDSVRKSPNRSRSTGNEVIIYEKEFEDGYVYYLEEKRDKRKSLSFQTMYKKKKGTDSSDGLMPNASPSTPTAPSDNFSSVSDGKVTNSASDKQGEDVKSSVQERLAAAEGEVNTAPTEAQKKAGNYKMGHVEIDGLQISIENPKGSMRRGKDPNGTPWEIEMKNTYGYIKGTTGVDGDKIDVFLSDNPTDGDVYVVDQYNTDGTFDEHKVMYGFTSASEAEVAYLSNYSADWAKGRKVVVTGVTREEFKKWLDASDRKKKPFAEYKSVKPIEAQNGGAAEAAEPRQKSSRLEIEGAEKLSAERAEAVERYAEGHYCVPIRVIADEADIRESGLSEVAVAQMMAALTEEDVPAVYCREDKKIYIFAGHKDSNVGSTLAHENAHALADAMPDGEEKRQMFETYRYALLADLDHGEDFSRIWKAVADAYPPHERAEEFVAYTVGLMYVSEGAAKAIRRILDGNAKSSIFQQLINPILYGTQTKTDAYRSANPENRRGGGAGVQQGRAGNSQAEGRADGEESAGGEAEAGLTATEAAEPRQKDNEAELNSQPDGGGDVRMSIGVSSEANAAVYQATKGMLESAGVKVHEVGNQEALAMLEKKNTPVAGLPNRANEKQPSGSVLAAHSGGSSSNATDSRKSEVKIDNNTRSAKNKIKKFKNGDFDGDYSTLYKALSSMGNLLSMRNRGGSRYTILRTDKGDAVAIRLSDHRANGNNFGRDVADRNLSIVIERKRYDVLDSEIEFTEVVIPLQVFEMHPKAVVSAIVNGVDDVLADKPFTLDESLGTVIGHHGNDVRFHIRTYHGTGAEFDRFDFGYVGSGEGAQAFGWGGYVTEVKGIGKSYASAIGGKELLPKIEKVAGNIRQVRQWLGKNEEYNKYARNAGRHLRELQREYRAAEKEGNEKDLKFYGGLIELQEESMKPENHAALIANKHRQIDDYQKELKDLEAQLAEKRHLYTVRIPDDTGDNYLDWDGGVTDSVRDKIVLQADAEGVSISFYGDEMAAGGYFAKMGENAAGFQLYGALVQSLGSDKAASGLLSRAGLTGIKYAADRNNGGRADGKKNYVVFKEDDMRITGHVRFLKGGAGTVYGWVAGGEVYLNRDAMNPETPVHEYTHLWDEMVRRENPELWARGVELMKQTPLWNEVLSDPNYADIRQDEDAIASEVHARLTGSDGAKLMEEMIVRAKKEGVFEIARAVSLVDELKRWLSDMFRSLKKTLDKWSARDLRNLTVESFNRMTLRDLAEGKNPRSAIISREATERGLRFHAAMARGREAFDALRDRVVAERGIVMPGLNEKVVRVVEVPRHDFAGNGKEALRAAEKWAKENIVGTHTALDSRGDEFGYTISGDAVEKYVSRSATGKSANIGVHLAALKKLPEIIKESIEAEVHPDYDKLNGIRNAENITNPETLIHRFYGAANVDGTIYRVKTTMREYRDKNRSPLAHSYEITQIELLEAPSDGVINNSGEPLAMTSNSSNVEPTVSPKDSGAPHRIANLLKGVEKSYDPGKKLLEESEKSELFRQGDERGSVADYSKIKKSVSASSQGSVGRDRFSEKRQAELGARERERMAARIRELAERLHLDNVEVVTDASQLEGMRAKAKGFFNKRTGKITIVLPNNLGTIDAEQTLLHEAVAHYGLRKLFGERFDTFLDNVYESATEEIRRKIAEMAVRNGWNFRTATEEYLAGLAETTNFEAMSRDTDSQSWWAKVKQLFIDMVEKVGFRGFRDKVGVTLTDNELRYILWRSYANLAEPGGSRSVFGEAADIAKQAELKVGNYAEGGIEAEYVEPEYVSAVNERFNEQLERWSSGVMRPEEVVQVGVPTGILSSLMPTVPILLRQKVLSKSRKKHGLSAAEMKNLPEALGRPIFVFKSSPETISVLTELKSADGNNLFVAIELGKDLELGGRAMIVNDILTIHGREIENVVLPILHNDSLVWADKKKGLEWLRSAKSNSQANTSQTLDDAAKKVKEFENPKLEEEELYRPGDFSPRDTAIARKEYERMVSSGGFQFQEAMQDSMLGLKKFYQAILGNDTQIEDVAGFENAYLFENRMSSMNAGEQHEYFRRFMEPLLKEIAKIAGANQRKRKELTDYLMAKHGLERNEHMRTEAAANGENADRDFAGLIGLTGEADWASAEATAKQWVDDYEKLYNTADLWKAINNATKATLEKVYLSGIISKKTYEEVRDMYEYYIPLRGWNETTSDQVYGYLTSKDGPLGGSIIKKAEGRSSMADDPIATIAMMADDAIRQGNRNLMKQRFLNFVLNHPSDVASVHDIWLEYDDVADEWRPVFADVEATDTADEVAQKVEAFEQRMESLKAAHPDKYKKGREAQHIPYKVVKNNLREHQVLIKRNGQTFVVTINGNPRAAQALNGLTNPDVELNNAVGDLLKLATWANRQLSAFYTTRNPDFVVSNFMRDMLYANCMTWVKESPRYALRFHKNFGKFAPISPRRLVRFRKGPNGGTVYSTGMLLRKWENGTLDMTDKYEKYFYEFMINGGETGYTNMRDIEGHKRAVAAELKKQSSVGRQAWAALGMQLDLLNRSVENCARFAAFVTSREFGRSIDRAIYDAKEVSVNFNKKGSGAKMAKAVGQTNLGKVAAYLGGIGRLVFIFWNAGIQGMANFGRQAKRHPAKFAAGATAMFTLGYIIPILAEMMGGGDGDDDDKNAYYNLPEYVRRSNICFRAGNQWISIPLPIEYRAMYGLGELAYGVTSGNERYSNKELAREIAAQVSQILPIDMLEGGGGWHAFIPSLFKPVTEAYLMNEGWTGLPIYRDNAFNKNDPEWTKAYASADNHLVDFTRWLNETTGGNDYKKGDIDINPAKLEYLLSGTFGGLFTFPNKGEKMRETMFGDREFEWRNMPIANRLIKSGDERTAYRKLQNEYYKYLEEYKETKRLYRKYEKADESGVLGYAERLDFLENSPEFLRAEIFDDFKDIIDANDNALNEETDKEIRAEIEAEQLADKRELVNALNDPAAYFRSLREAGMLSDDYTNYLERSFGMKLRIQGQ